MRDRREGQEERQETGRVRAEMGGEEQLKRKLEYGARMEESV